MKSRDYWLQREQMAHNDAIRDDEKFRRELIRYCDLMQESIEKEINAFYGKYASKEGISIADAKKRADKLDIESYAKKAEQYVKTHDLSDQANEEMRLYNLTMKVNRLELLKANIGLEMIKAFEDITNGLEDDMEEAARQVYERLAGILGNTIHGNEKQIKSLVNASFKGAKFDENIWGYETALKSQLTTKITQGLIQGKSAQELARSLRKDFDTTRYEAERLMRTELTRVRVQAQVDSYEQAGIEEYEFVNFSSAGFAGGPICPVCTKKNGEHFPIRDFMPGTNAPPMHPNCRCSTVPYVGEDRDQAQKTPNDFMPTEKVSAPNFKHGLRGLGFKIYSNKEIKRIAKETAAIAQKHVQMKSRWSGKIVVNNALHRIGKLWNCSILTTSETSPHAILHEQLHALSISRCPRKQAKRIYYENRNIEEGTVQLCTQEISKKERIPIDQSQYDSICDNLRELNRILKIGRDDYDFAIQLIKVPVDERLEWLERKRDARIRADRNISIQDLYDVNDIIDSMEQLV